MRRLAFLVTVLVSVSACTADTVSTTSAATSTQPESSTDADLQVELDAALDALTSIQADVDRLEATIERLETELSAAREETRRALTEAAAQGRDAEGLQTLVDVVTAAFCPKTAIIGPADLAEDLIVWLRETESRRGEVPSDTEAVIGSIAVEDGWWLFGAEFNRRFQPGIFARDPGGNYVAAGGGISGSEPVIRALILNDHPYIPFKLALCLDVSAFVMG